MACSLRVRVRVCVRACVRVCVCVWEFAYSLCVHVFRQVSDYACVCVCVSVATVYEHVEYVC